MASVTITGVTKSFGDVQVLQEFSQKFEDGEFITLLGPSGCGKTTMLRLIAGFEKPTSGEIYIGDRPVSGKDNFVSPEKREIGMVFQSIRLLKLSTLNSTRTDSLQNCQEDSSRGLH